MNQVKTAGVIPPKKMIAPAFGYITQWTNGKSMKKEESRHEQPRSKSMSDLRQAAQQALEALEPLVKRACPWGETDWIDGGKAITALRAALAEPDPEPVAWMMINNNHKSLAPSLHWQPQQGWHITWEAVPLYTAPTPRRPLRDEEVDQVLERHAGGANWSDAEYRSAYALARAVIAAYEAAQKEQEHE